eukprot:7777696-Alexandrium_andersonii.AAC.1
MAVGDCKPGDELPSLLPDIRRVFQWRSNAPQEQGATTLSALILAGRAEHADCPMQTDITPDAC